MNPPEGGDSLAPPAREGDEISAAIDDARDSATGEPHERSLLDDVEALIEDGRTYLEAEIAYQKTRAAYVAEGAKGALILGSIAALLAFLALIGLVVGLIIALSPLLTAWGASAVVVVILLAGAGMAVKGAASRWTRLMAAIRANKAP